ncbi:MAG: hypothetical protein IT458_10370 [Planctomycetes bacterium]|nr:hypothetical protein [Planctomycetota bacterium]
MMRPAFLSLVLLALVGCRPAAPGHEILYPVQGQPKELVIGVVEPDRLVTAYASSKALQDEIAGLKRKKDELFKSGACQDADRMDQAISAREALRKPGAPRPWTEIRAALAGGLPKVAESAGVHGIVAGSGHPGAARVVDVTAAVIALLPAE